MCDFWGMASKAPAAAARFFQEIDSVIMKSLIAQSTVNLRLE